jgi:hypothetical protein
MAVDYTKVNQNEQIMEALKAANDVKTTVEGIQQPTPIDEAALKLSLRNQVLAGSGIKKAFLGGLTESPTIAASDLQTLGYTAAAANALIAERDALRAYFLALLS